MEELSKAVIELQLSYGLSLRTIQKMVRDVYKNTNDAPIRNQMPNTSFKMFSIIVTSLLGTE